MNSFGARLKRHRKLAGLTQEQLAKELDVSTVAVQNWNPKKIRYDLKNFQSYPICFIFR